MSHSIFASREIEIEEDLNFSENTEISALSAGIFEILTKKKVGIQLVLGNFPKFEFVVPYIRHIRSMSQSWSPVISVSVQTIVSTIFQNYAVIY